MAKRDLDLIPLFWRDADDGVTKVLEAVESSLNDLFLDIDTRYNALKIETCDDFKPELMRPMYLYKLVTDKGEFNYGLWNTLRNYQKNFFVDRYFIVPETGVSGTYTGRWLVTQEIRDAETLYCGKFIANGEGFFVDTAGVSTPKNTVIFDTDPFVTFSGYWKDTEITTPWRKTYPCEMLTLWASDLKMSESVIDTHYADLVMDETFQKQFRSTGAYSAFIYNFYKVLYQGATVQGLCGFVNSISGYDYIKSDIETVERFEFVYDPDSESTPLQRIIYTDKNKYVLPIDVPVAHWIQLGASLPKFTPLTELIKVYTYLEDPDWIFEGDFGYIKNLVAYKVVSSDFLYTRFLFTNRKLPPRFDICRPIEAVRDRDSLFLEDFQNGMQTLEEGLWHNVVGPNYILIDFLDFDLFEQFNIVFTALLREILPVHVFCDLTYRWGGWYFYDEEPISYDSSDGAWFADEDESLIEDTEGDNIYSIMIDQPDVCYGDIVTIYGRAPEGKSSRVVIIDSDGPETGWMLQALPPTTNPFEAGDDEQWQMMFKILEVYSPYDAVLRLETADWTVPARASLNIRIVPHYLEFDPIAYPIVFAGQPVTISGRTDAPVEGHTVTVTWPKYPGDPTSTEVESVTVNLTAGTEYRTFSFVHELPAGVYSLKGTVTHGTRTENSVGADRFLNMPTELSVFIRRTEFDLNTATGYSGAALRNDSDVQLPVQVVNTIT